MSIRNITLYAAKVCPWAHRADFALAESGLNYKRFEIDLRNKPSWYAPQVNPASKVPAISFGGPDVDPSTPSSESVKLAESSVLVEFVADLVGGTTKALLPADPVERAKARFFVETVASKIAGAFQASCMKGEDPATQILPAIDALVDALPKEGGYVQGAQLSTADIAVAPHLARTLILLENDLGAYDAGLGKKTWDILRGEGKYERFWKYWGDLTAREGWKKTWYPETALEQLGPYVEGLRAARTAQEGKS